MGAEVGLCTACCTGWAVAGEALGLGTGKDAGTDMVAAVCPAVPASD